MLGARIVAAFFAVLVGWLLVLFLRRGVIPIRVIGTVRHAEHPAVFWFYFTWIAAFEVGLLWVAFAAHY